MLEAIANWIEKRARDAFPVQTIEHAGMTYADRAVTRLADEPPVPDIEPLGVTTLTALVAYILANPDKVDDFVVHVESPTMVNVHTIAYGEKQVRQTWLIANAIVPELMLSVDPDPDNAWWVPISNLAIHLRTCFQEDEARTELVKFLGNWVETDSIAVSDDGVTQEVTVRSGLSLAKGGSAPSLMDLTPIRTFEEVDQPKSPFVVRVRKGGTAALFTADGGTWRPEAIRSIGEYLREELGEGVLVLS